MEMALDANQTMQSERVAITRTGFPPPIEQKINFAKSDKRNKQRIRRGKEDGSMGDTVEEVVTTVMTVDKLTTLTREELVMEASFQEIEIESDDTKQTIAEKIFDLFEAGNSKPVHSAEMIDLIQGLPSVSVPSNRIRITSLMLLKLTMGELRELAQSQGVDIERTKTKDQYVVQLMEQITSTQNGYVRSPIPIKFHQILTEIACAPLIGAVIKFSHRDQEYSLHITPSFSVLNIS